MLNLLLALVATPVALPPEIGALNGHVRGPDGAPIVGARVTVVETRRTTLTDAEGRYRFVTIRPGAYPWRNHHNAWRPSHIHFSVFGHAFLTRLVTQMYFPGDPLLPIDPIFNSIPEPRVRERLIAAFDLALTEPAFALGYRFDIVLRGQDETPMEHR